MSSNWPDSVAMNLVLDRVAEPPEAIAAAIQRFVTAFEERVGATPWEVIDGPPWAGSAAEQTEIVRARPSTAATGEPDPSDGYGFTLYARREPVALAMGVDVGGPVLGRRRPTQHVQGRMVDGRRGPVQSALAEAMFDSLVEGWQPLYAQLSTADINIAARRGGWLIPAGYRVWLRDGTVTFDWLADGVTARPFAGGTMIAVPDDWPPDQIANRLLATYERTGTDVVPH